jgi:hypothetical protein
MLKKSKVKIDREVVRWVRSLSHEPEPGIAGGSHHILIISHHSASRTLQGVQRLLTTQMPVERLNRGYLTSILPALRV